MSALPHPATPLLRPMREHDVPQVAAVERRAYEFPWSAGIFSDCLRAGYCSWALELRGAIVGYGIMAVALDEAHLLNLCVDPLYQRRGYARLMLAHLEQLAVRHRASLLFLEVRPSNAQALALYARSGFGKIAVRRGYYPARVGREDAWVYSKTFAQAHPVESPSRVS